MPTYKDKLKGVRLPIELMTPELQRRGVSPEDIDDKRDVIMEGFCYLHDKQYLSATGKFDFLPEGDGVIAVHLNRGKTLSEAIAYVEGLVKPNVVERLYSVVRVFLTNNRELNPPLYVFTTVAQWK